MLVDLKVTLNTLLWRIQKPTTMTDWQTKVQGDLSAETLYPSDAKVERVISFSHKKLGAGNTGSVKYSYYVYIELFSSGRTKNLATAQPVLLNIPIIFLLNYFYDATHKKA